MSKTPSFQKSRTQMIFQLANDALAAERQINPAMGEVIPAPTGWGKPPSDWGWQHATIEQAGGRAGVLQLVPEAQPALGRS
ncbi:hypothetical protein [Sorangium sp. So ce362]|uniref:hypothetical protein n=1 Tax=Sorangium sp. So ce362 TaxID=3133303 RepID=UPI003F5F010C